MNSRKLFQRSRAAEKKASILGAQIKPELDGEGIQEKNQRKKTPLGEFTELTQSKPRKFLLH